MDYEAIARRHGGIPLANSSAAQAVGFQRPEMEHHKRAGMKAAASSPGTPDHLKEHLERHSSVQKGDQVKLPNGKIGTVELADLSKSVPLVRVRTVDGKVFRYLGKKDVQSLELMPKGKLTDGEARSYLSKAGWDGKAAPTDQQKDKARDLARKDKREF